MSLDEARALYRRARDCGFYPAHDLGLLAERLKSGEWVCVDVELLIVDAEEQKKK